MLLVVEVELLTLDTSL